MKKKWHRYHYKNLSYLSISIVIAILLLQNQSFRNLLIHLGNYGYFGAFIGGALFVSTFTVSIGVVLLSILTSTLDPIEIGIIAGLGAVIGDLTIFQFVRSKSLISEVKHFFNYFGGERISHLIHTKYFSWSLPVIGALIIASPLPDEFGIGLMGISKLKTYQFIILSYVLNSIGIFLVVSASFILK